MTRHDPERRQRPTRWWDVFHTAGRRSHFRRSSDLEASRYPIVDRHDATTGVLVVLVLLFTLADGVLTLLLLDHSYEEANPLMAYLVERGPLWFLAGKYLLTAIGLAVFLVLKYYRLFGTRLRLGHCIPILAVLYVVLLVYQLSIFRMMRIAQQPSGSTPGLARVGPRRDSRAPLTKPDRSRKEVIE
ncbi:hypothetical protein SAMN05444166_2585 [Singulisphaera sp. GP187]|uniref:DUF5658 family protein n=1 Tax=Singulisphaera sp. GP187 TaxID=1882752 RepID=UPI00092C91C5|nr:DUF5658 family protein [Singulisphaera sp. GP187]SIO12513.1 hypothetical protein SAMN05444166_2585 [Singulisphaera sp. GP187]